MVQTTLPVWLFLMSLAGPHLPLNSGVPLSVSRRLLTLCPGGRAARGHATFSSELRQQKNTGASETLNLKTSWPIPMELSRSE